MMRTLVAILLASCFVGAQQTQPSRDARAVSPAPPGPTGTGVLSGTVTADDGRPIRFAYVLLIGTTTGVAKLTSSDTDGRFVFNNLPVDRFTVGASKPPFLGTVAGAKRPGRPGAPVAVAAGQKVTNVAIRMAMGGAITGVITDEKGQPGTGTMVGVLQWRMQNGERLLFPVGGSYVTDDEGRYRVHGLLPGEYFVTAIRPGLPQPSRALSVAEVDAALAGGNPSPAPPPPPVRYAPVYFPGTTRASGAVPITVSAGEERNNADFRLETVATSRVEGSVVTADGQPAASVFIIMAEVSNVQQGGGSARVAPDGRFAVPNVQPGSYMLMVNGQGPLAGQYARALIEVAGADVRGLQLTMKPALSMTGRLAFDAAGAPPVAGRRVPMRAISGLAASTGAANVAATDPTGVFAVSNLIPGRYVIGGPLAFGATPDTMTWALQSVVADGRDVTDLPLEIGDAAPKEVVVTYTDKWQELSGRLQSQSGAPVSDYTIIVFPEDKAYWFQGTRRIVVARPGTDGRFTLAGKGLTTLPPGRYLLAAVTDIARDEQFDPAFLAQIVSAGIPITLGPGEKKIQDLAIR